ncbi:subunit length determinant protein [Diaminobutyricimonas aerilata]|uniref:Subunit length determinant protein n=1 Tax=Diaminobutyricimonas aerilata TaxID=1162967 RepID=A0A2M9CKQ8_9MICO|nr:Wzz/FepE/Etk N-terminal domain-containing protein [Diaminobutyricimonas aerilata]PJJ72449.1 subunit length determinant protein [Diaminobutyricimonas aerilata]
MTETNTWSIEDLVRRIASSWVLITVFGVIGIGLAAGAGFVWPERYEAKAVLTVEPIGALQPGTDEVNMETERVVATSTEVLTPAAEQLGWIAPRALATGVTVSVPKGSQVLEISYTDPDPQRAADAANAIATAYSEQRVQNAEKVVQSATDSLSARIGELQTQLDGVPAGSSAARAIDVQIVTLQERLATLVSSTFYSGSIVSPAATPRDSTTPSLAVFLAAGAGLGVLLGLFVALVRARLRESSPRTATPQTAVTTAPVTTPATVTATNGRPAPLRETSTAVSRERADEAGTVERASEPAADDAAPRPESPRAPRPAAAHTRPGSRTPNRRASSDGARS